jgi:hypothetical protein
MAFVAEGFAGHPEQQYTDPDKPFNIRCKQNKQTSAAFSCMACLLLVLRSSSTVILTLR